jgi:hypothetical protein
MVYEFLDWWPVMDYIASLSHIFNGFLIMYIALYYNVSLFMFLYVASLGQYYIKAISKIQKMASKMSRFTCISSQIDLRLASFICKYYNERSTFEFHETRTGVWNF